jgi:hypothetical protein
MAAHLAEMAAHLRRKRGNVVSKEPGGLTTTAPVNGEKEG